MECIVKVDEKTKVLLNNNSSKFYKSIFQQKKPLNILNEIHNKLAANSLGRANGNFEFISHQFYALALMRGLGLGHNNTGTNKTYIPVHKTTLQFYEINLT